MTLDFEGRVVAVTGAAMGFGRAIAQSFAARGAEVHATDISASALAETARDTAIRTAVVDLTDRAAAGAWVADVERQAGRAIDILVNNAGGMMGQHHRPVEDVSDEDWDAIMALNVNATFATVRAAAPGMKHARAGRIINISSGAAFRPSRTRIQAYCTSKHAVLGLTRQLAMELGPWGITVNTVAPGLVLTDADKQGGWDSMSEERRSATLSGIALGRLGEAQDIADATMFFASDLAKFISGQILPVNGGSF
ncbi:SDR family NAD(P)-dependent oxidoreductase [Roseomonas marmotae]|uniref:SDR family oxidoreductase n=1 Tax=Roseomonas marmotae TaxID=2768161 RepID=A0ABS3KA67_9PROT|nr:SDR family NAD(P)-dependent oxidoreductase [Roseomonas marmotae]MBO1073251.1 SDR family oxidoreductase [Roseomonas marmotae]QTI79125.1 SDR family oxidoreductase [Roseomonas marmotae]